MNLSPLFFFVNVVLFLFFCSLSGAWFFRSPNKTISGASLWSVAKCRYHQMCRNVCRLAQQVVLKLEIIRNTVNPVGAQMDITI